jgi:beta-lactamase class A
MYNYIIIILCFILSACSHNYSINNIEHSIQLLEHQYKSTIGISAFHIETEKNVFAYNDQTKFPMASTVKIPIGVYLLHLAENNKISLDKMITVNPGDLVLGSGLMGYFLSRPGLSMSLYNMFEPMLTISDNSATDIILENIGGPKAVYSFLKKHNLGDIRVNRSIRQIYFDTSGITSPPSRSTMTLTKYRALIDGTDDGTKIRTYKEFWLDPRDTTTPTTMTLLLTKLYNKELLNGEYTQLMLDVMSKEKNTRIAKYLPQNISMAHKGGTWYDILSSGTQYRYRSDVAIITLPNNKGHLVMSIYIKSDQTQDMQPLTEALSKAAKIVYQYFISN